MSQCDRKQRRDELLADTQHRVYRTVTLSGGTTINVENKLRNDLREQNKTRNWRESTESNTIINYSYIQWPVPPPPPHPALVLLFFTRHCLSSRLGPVSGGSEAEAREPKLESASVSRAEKVDKYSCANTARHQSSAAWLCLTIRFCICFGTELGQRGRFNRLRYILISSVAISRI